MADINPAQTLINNINNDAKLRALSDLGDNSDLSGSQFMDMISSTSGSSASEALQKILDKADQQDYSANETGDAKYSYSISASAAASAPDAPKNIIAAQSDVTQKINARLKEIAAKDDTPVTDTKAMKVLQKVAAFLVKANDEGKVNLPPEMVQKLKDFLAKGDDLKATDMTQFMHDFNDAFRSMVIALPAASASASTDGAAAVSDKDLVWPQDIQDAFKDLGLTGAAGAVGKPLNILDVLRAVKSLVNESEKAAIKTLDDKTKEAGLPQDQASILVAANAANADPKATATQSAATASTDDKAAADAVASAAAAGNVSADDANVKKAVKEIQKGMEKALAENNKDKAVAAAADASKATAPLSTPITKALDAAKPQQQAAVLPTPDIAAPAQPKAPVKSEAPSLTKLTMDAQVPGKNDDASFNNNSRDNANSARSNTVDAQQVKNNVVAAAAPLINDVKVSASADISAAPDMTVNNVMAPASVDSLSATVKAAAKAAATPTGPQLPSAATQQVIAQIQARADKSSQISVQLTPLELGQVEVRLSIKSDGQVHTVISADKPETLALLQKDASQLERSLQGAGLNANSENMSFNLRDQNNAQQFGQQRKRFSRDNLNTGVTEVALNVAPEGQIFTDTRVNYHA